MVERVTAQRYGMNDAKLDAFGKEIEGIREEHINDLGAEDVRYIKRIIRWQRALMVIGRGVLFFGLFPPAWIVGTLCLAIGKILDNMEIGHNIMHGQYDWSRDPALQSSTFDWDTACPAEQWKHSHNFEHHTFTNIVGKDRDVGYGVLRMSEDQRWHPVHLGNGLFALLLAIGFDHGVMLHDVAFDEVRAGKKSWSEAKKTLKKGLRKTAKQSLKDYVLWPLLTGPLFLHTLAANFTANVLRNLWTYTVIFCGHFPDGVHQFTEAECENESKGHWYFRQLLGSANLTGGPRFHVMAGNLSHQVEHHLFPDLPARRYASIAPRIEAICKRYGLAYNKGPMHRQFATVVGRILRLSLPPKHKPGRGATNALPMTA